MSFRVELSDRAYADLDRLTAALAARRPEDAGRVTAALSAALPRLESFPLACGLAHESPHFAEELRHLLFEVRKGRPHRALFVVRGDRVIILTIRAPGERPVGPEDVGG